MRPAGAFGQSATISVGNDSSMHVRVPAFHFIKGAPLARLKDGRSIPLELDLFVLAKPDTLAVAQTRQSFVLSYDLWEERFAVTQTGTPSRSISHLGASDAEAWCLESLAVPTSALGTLGREAPLWIRLEYRVQDDDPAPNASDDAGLTLRGLIDRLSRRRAAGELRGSIVAGPLRLP